LAAAIAGIFYLNSRRDHIARVACAVEPRASPC